LKRGREREVMKRIRLLILLGAVAAALPLGLLSPVAKAAGSTTDQVSINQYADYDAQGLLQVGLQVRCFGQDGLVSVDVAQSPPETPYQVSEGISGTPVVCDGRTHSVGVTIVGAGYDAGKALATATLEVPTTGVPPVRTTVVNRWIVIRVV
jgi:hypothetical protein